MPLLFLAMAACLLPCEAAGLYGADLQVEVDLSKPLHTMRGGIGASFHAIETPMLVTPGGDARFGGIISHGGSGWGAYPPAEDEKAWRQIEHHADWLGLDWCRVEFEQRMYEPERGRYDWNNPEMRILYRILDWCQRRHCDVFLTQISRAALAAEPSGHTRGSLPLRSAVPRETSRWPSSTMPTRLGTRRWLSIPWRQKRGCIATMSRKPTRTAPI
jgi:hypothetical protein